MEQERYAVVSCHVERPLDDRVWRRFAEVQARRPGGFAVAALVRPPDTDAGEDAALWLERAREAVTLGPFGLHTHWTAPEHARPTGGATGERVLREGEWLRRHGLDPRAFCGGGWYTDADVAEACAELGYLDCTPRAARPPYLPSGERWASLETPARIRLPSGRALDALPTTHSLGDLARALWKRDLPAYVHVYFHDTDLLDRRRSALVHVLLPVLARRATTFWLDAPPVPLAGTMAEIAWADVERL